MTDPPPEPLPAPADSPRERPSPEEALAPAPTPPDLALRDRPPPDLHPAAVYLARLAPGSRRTMRAALDTVARLLSAGRLRAQELDWSRVRYPHAAAVRARLAESHAPATASKILCALRGVLGEAWRLGLVTAEDYHRAVDIPAVRGSSLPRGRALAAGELRALFEDCAADPRPAAARDAALLAVLYGTGLRRSEAVALDLADFSPESRELRVRRGKGRQARVAYAPPGCMDALRDWLALRGPGAGPLFCPVNKGGRIHLRRMSDAAVHGILEARARRACVADFSPHDLRRTFISDLLEAGADISLAQQLAGHRSVTTTARYDRRPDVARRRAADLLHVPYTPRIPKEEPE